MSNVKVEVFTDFDGTLSVHDTGCLLIDDENSMGVEKRRELEHLIMEGKMTYRDAVYQMWDAVGLTLEEAWDKHLNHCQVDPGFPGFYKYCKGKGFPVVVVSSGLEPVVRQVLTNFMGDEAKEIEVVANTANIKDRKWEIIYHDDSEYGNDKSLALSKARAAADKNTIFVFCGDGVSDISAAKHCDLLFARNGKDLVTYCTRHNIPFIGFDSFEEIHSVVQDLVDGNTRLEKDAATGYCKVVSNA